MIDIRNFYSIQEETVLRRTAASYHQVVPECSCGSDSGKRLYDTRYVTVTSGTLFYLFEAYNAQSERTFGCFTKRGSHNTDFLQVFAARLQLDREKYIFIGNAELGGYFRLISQEGSLKTITAGGDSGDLEITDGIGCCSLCCVPDHHCCVRHRFTTCSFLYDPFYGIAFLGLHELDAGNK